MQCYKCHGTGKYSKKNRPGILLQCVECNRKRKLEADLSNMIDRRKSYRVGIVGSGIGGAALAKALSRLGYDVVMFEKDTQFSERKQGYGLTIQQGFSALKYLEVDVGLDTLSYSHFAFDSKGEILGYFGPAFSHYFDRGDAFSKKKSGKFNGQGKFNVHTPRQRLRELLLDGLENTTDLRWGSVVESVEKLDDEKVLVRARSIATQEVFEERLDLVVGCDGIYSRMRSLLMNDQLRYLSTVVVLGIVKCSHPLTLERVGESMDGTVRIYWMPYTAEESEVKIDPMIDGSNTTMWQLSFHVASEEEARDICRDSESLKAHAMKLCKDWHDPIPGMISETPPELMSGHPVFDRCELESETLKSSIREHNLRGSFMLLGDAAHPMTPFKGQGANQALLDAVLLTKLMTDPSYLDNPGDALDSFADEMLRRSASKVRGSREAAFNLHSGYALKRDVELDILVEENVNAQSSTASEDLVDQVVRVRGYGHHPHVLHQDKIQKSRENQIKQ